ncbi:ATP-dependent RNA helicase HrpA [Thiosulfativibrio zosterae]|uniref:ATP-dependent helicase n=1 Tax=Thiosulfativibrio zosterae TaxID=2675053 RepID=A0A6F8PNK2_9GAMM|nr:ATP-dependent RNA helicase HrpA [Thiosulfativibrio zosterae]BBP43701.1 ATP-dependent helicase [Thiosulfativibrio zosterae]
MNPDHSIKNVIENSDLDKQNLYKSIKQCLVKDRFYFSKQLKALQLSDRKLGELASKNDQAWLNLAQKIAHSKAQVALKRQAVPKPIVFDANLPVAARKDELLALIQQHQVVVLAGETGSGKTTQIPKICLEAGRGIFGRIACTQPRRLAARSVAERIAEELGSTLGNLVGYQVRFHDQVHEQSLIKVMTDGILLAEIQNDKFLNQYDTIIIDEAHERSINIDFLLGILKQLLPKRPDLKLIITSATIDTQRFSQHFDNAPIVEISGRTYPVEVRYRPLSQFEDDEGNVFEQDIATGIAHALDELALEDPFGDVLVFQIGERDIKETAEVLKKHKLPNTEIIPLYARLSLAEQNKVFQLSQKRRVILSTNVAETSLTVPGIKFVIDPGLNRISRYSVRSKVQRLPIEKISQASANQRKGRCGRVSSGVCIRLYDEADFNARPEFTEPEIHRTSLASVILQMTQLKLGDVHNFPFIEPPEDKAVNDGFRQLHEIGALDEHRQLTETGQQIARLPLDPRIAKMVMEAQANGVLAEVLLIAAAISIQDPRDINESNRQVAKQAHAKFEDSRSDFLFFLNLWRFYENQRRHLSQNKLRKLCKTNLLNFMRMKEWHDLFVQLEMSLKQLGIKVPQCHLYEEVRQGNQVTERLADIHHFGVHRSLMAGLLGNLAMRDDEIGYLGARNTKLFIHPSSALFKSKPKWILSAELVETTKLYARTNAAIDVAWVERLAGHLIKKSYADPHWLKNKGQVSAYESVTLYGLPIVNRRPCNYGAINPVEARKIFIQGALVQGEMDSKVAFFVHNQKLIAEVQSIEQKLRRLDYMIDDVALYHFYDACIPSHIYNKPAFEKWAKKSLFKNADALQSCYLTQEFLLKQAVDESLLDSFPSQMALRNQLPLKIDYQFDPGKQQDGVVFHIPLNALNVAQASEFEWLTPGFLKEKIANLIKLLPKQLRKQFIPAPQYADLVLPELSKEFTDKKGGLLAQLVWSLNRRAQHRVTEADFAVADLPSHLKPYFILEDEGGRKLAEGADLQVLKDDYLHLVERKIHQHHQKRQAEKVIEQWDFGDLPAQQTLKNQGLEMVAYPALQVKKDQVILGLVSDAAFAKQLHGEGVLQLLRLALADKEKYLQKKLPLQKACLCFATYGTCQDLTQQVIDRALTHLVPTPESIRTQAVYLETLETVRLAWINHAQQIAKQVEALLLQHQKIAQRLRGKVNPRWLGSLADLQGQLDGLISKEFVRTTPQTWFEQMPRYLQGIEKRLEKMDIDPTKDLAALEQLSPLLKTYQLILAENNPQNQPGLVEIRWALEELRLSLFAQPMKTLKPVSIARIEKMLKSL